MKVKKVPFSEITPGSFFRVGRTLYQRREDCKDSSQIVGGPGVIGRTDTHNTSDLVTPVNATIVEEK